MTTASTDALREWAAESRRSGQPMMLDPDTAENVARIVAAARRCFATVEVDGRSYLQSAVCTWNTPALVDALRRFEDFPR